MKNRNLEIVHMLLERKAKLTATDKSGEYTGPFFTNCKQNSKPETSLLFVTNLKMFYSSRSYVLLLPKLDTPAAQSIPRVPLCLSPRPNWDPPPPSPHPLSCNRKRVCLPPPEPKGKGTHSPAG